jgi:ferredoxin
MAFNWKGKDFDNTDQMFEITILDSGETFPCSSTQAILLAMVGLGRKGIPSGCHGGGCGVCKIQIVSGEVSLKVMSLAHVSEQEQDSDIVLACRAIPCSDIQLTLKGLMRKRML